MKISGLFAKVIEATPKIEISYDIEIGTGGKSFSIDRGSLSDAYECEFMFRGERDYIDSIAQALTTARTSKTPLSITECEERFFGQNVNHSVAISCIASEVGEVQVFAKNVFELRMVLLPSGLAFTGTPSLPAMLQHEQISSSHGGKWGTRTNSTYYSDNYQSDYDINFPEFQGGYIFTNSELESFMSFQKTNRGTPFTVTDAQFGVENMFGVENTDVDYDVVLKSFEFERISAATHSVKIVLLKVKT